MARVIAFEIPGIRLTSLTNAREHWSKRAARAKTQRGRARLYAQVAGVHLVGLPLVITIIRRGPGTLDDDNAVTSAKHVRDGIADALGIDDRSPLVTWVVQQERARQWSVKVDVKRRKEQAA
jgi:hypothetical protein